MKSYSPEFKAAIVKAVKEAGDKVSKGTLAKKFGIRPSTLSTFLSNEKKIQSRIDIGET